MEMEKNTYGFNTNSLVLLLGLAGFISAADNWFVSPILPAISNEMNILNSQAGIILTAYLVPYGFMQPIYGYLSDRWGKVKVLQAIILGLAGGTFGCSLSSSLGVLCFWRAITGFFAAGIIAVSLALIGDAVPFEQRQAHVGKFMGFVALGQGLSVGLGGFLAKYLSWQIAFVCFALASLCVLYFFRKLPKDSPNPTTNNFFKEVITVTLNAKGRVIFPLAMLTGFLLLGLYSYLGAFLYDITKLDYQQVGIVMMFFGISAIFASSILRKFIQRNNHKKTIIVGGCLALIAALILRFFPYWYAGWIVTVILGFSYIFIQSTLATMAFDVASETKGLPSALIGLGLFGGGGLGTAVASWILSIGGYQMLWSVFSIEILTFILIVSLVRFDSLSNEIFNKTYLKKS